MYNSIIKQNIRARRKELGLTQNQMAEKLGIDERTYKLIEAESGTRMFYDRISDIAAILQAPLKSLLSACEEGALYCDDEAQLSLLQEERTGLERDLANLRFELAERDNTIKALREEIARLNGCIDDKDYIIRLLKADHVYSATK